MSNTSKKLKCPYEKCSSTSLVEYDSKINCYLCLHNFSGKIRCNLCKEWFDDEFLMDHNIQDLLKVRKCDHKWQNRCNVYTICTECGIEKPKDQTCFGQFNTITQSYDHSRVLNDIFGEKIDRLKKKVKRLEEKFEK